MLWIFKKRKAFNCQNILFYFLKVHRSRILKFVFLNNIKLDEVGMASKTVFTGTLVSHFSVWSSRAYNISILLKIWLNIFQNCQLSILWLHYYYFRLMRLNIYFIRENRNRKNVYSSLFPYLWQLLVLSLLTLIGLSYENFR